MRDKQVICIALTVALRLTSQFEDLKYLEYDDKSETVTARFENGLTVIGVEADSEYAMIRDIVDSLGGYRFGR